MYFRELVENNVKNDRENNTYTRYMIRYDRKLDKPELVELRTSKTNELNIRMFDVDLPKASDDDLSSGIYEDLISCTYLEKDGLDFFIDEDPIVELKGMVFDKKAVIQDVYTRTDHERKGLGSFVLQLAQDYYAKTDHVGIGGCKYIFANRNNLEHDLVYQTKLERRLGGMGEWLAKTRAGILGRKHRTRAYSNFLAKNGFSNDDEPLSLAGKQIIHKRNIISNELLDEVNCPKVVQCIREVYNIDDFVSSDEQEKNI